MLFDRHEGGERAVLVHVDFSARSDGEDPDEFLQLCISAGVDPVKFVRARRSAPHPRVFIGEGKLEEIAETVRDEKADVVLFNHNLFPGQERNLEKALSCRVLDRTGVILDIFAQRARTHEGKLQVELAQLEHMSTRLIRGWTHLERQKGGIGMRGPGETQLETDRRLLRARIKNINGRLDKVRQQRDLARRARRRADVPLVALVGYTNAGKSTLFNTVTNSEVYAADQLFATLDPTLRKVDLGSAGHCILADTVGFIRHLPHKLIEAFRATLEEAAQADLLLHVVDAADPERDFNRAQVQAVLEEIGAAEVPVLEVWNKTDLLGRDAGIDRDADNKPMRLWLSARRGQGIDLLEVVLAELLTGDMVQKQVTLQAAEGELRARFHALSSVQHEQFMEDGSIAMQVHLQSSDWDRLISEFPDAGLGDSHKTRQKVW